MTNSTQLVCDSANSYALFPASRNATLRIATQRKTERNSHVKNTPATQRNATHTSNAVNAHSRELAAASLCFVTLCYVTMETRH